MKDGLGNRTFDAPKEAVTIDQQGCRYHPHVLGVMTGQNVEDARRQYKQDRDPREPIFEFKRRTLVHFAVDTECVLMTTRLAGSATHFLPFDKGQDGGAGNPPDPAGRTYRTGYLWEEALHRGRF